MGVVKFCVIFIFVIIIVILVEIGYGFWVLIIGKLVNVVI